MKTNRTKFILHSLTPENLILMARAAKHCGAKEDLKEGEFGVLEYDTAPTTYVYYVKRKGCITLYEHVRTYGQGV